MKNFLPLIIAGTIILGSCKEKVGDADAYGSFEATEITVSSESNGRILSFPLSEGSLISKGDVIAIIDTTLFHLQKSEIDAGMKGTRTKLTSIEAQNEILRQQIQNLNINIDRTRKMLQDNAATTKQLDDLTGQVSVIEKQIAANNSQKASVSAELNVYETKKATLGEQISRSVVKSPITGTLLSKFAEEGEITAAGKPLAKIADLTRMKLKVYVSGGELGKIKTGQECTVRTDNGDKGYATFKGVVSYISGKAEFTPKIIQTKEERVTLVYAVTIEVNNDGTIKSGMPGEAIF